MDVGSRGLGLAGFVAALNPKPLNPEPFAALILIASPSLKPKHGSAGARLLVEGFVRLVRGDRKGGVRT